MKYLVSFYWACQTLLTIGYGDVISKSATERMICIIWMLIGIGFYSWVIGNIIMLINLFDQENDQLDKQLTSIRQFSATYNLPQKVTNRISNHLRNYYIQKKFEDSEKLLNIMSLELRSELVQMTHKQVFTEIRFFKLRDEKFTSAIVHELKPIDLSTNDILYS